MKVTLDPSKVRYDGKSFIVVYTEEELKKKFDELKEALTDAKADCQMTVSVYKEMLKL